MKKKDKAENGFTTERAKSIIEVERLNALVRFGMQLKKIHEFGEQLAEAETIPDANIIFHKLADVMKHWEATKAECYLCDFFLEKFALCEERRKK